MKKRYLLSIALLVLLVLTPLILLLIYTDNAGIQWTHYQVSSAKIPAEFDGFRIAQVADLHNTEFGENNADLLSLLREAEPDIIVFTGDQVDARNTRTDLVVALAKEAIQIAPCYLINGNHEGSITQFSQLKSDLRETGVTILEDETLELHQNGGVLTFIGLNDPTLNSHYLTYGPDKAIAMTLSELTWAPERYSILLSHHPEYLELYAKHNVDLVLSGHAHGGQIRLGNQGVIAPHQGLFPKYDGGIYTMANTTMVRSRGLGNSLFPWRINNPPELVMVELSSQ